MSTLLLYGSETGTAEDYAFILGNTLCDYTKVDVMPMDNVSPSNLLQLSHLIIICSTTGQGVFPQNAQKFYRFLLKKHPSDLFSNLTIHVCGLGDSSYSQYNVCGKKLWLRFCQLGAKQGQRGEMDECAANGGEKWWEAWALKVVEDVTGVSLGPKFPIGGIYTEKSHLKPLYTAKYIGNEPNLIQNGSSTVSGYTLLAREFLTEPSYDQEVFKFQFESDSNNTHNLGDTLLIYPQNPASSVNDFIFTQDLSDKADKLISVSCPKHLLPKNGWFNNGLMTLREFLTHHVNIHSPPPRRFFSIVWRFATEEREREKLYELAQLEETEQLFNYINRPRRTLVECIQEFFSLKIPLEWLIDACGLIRPREYSISSPPESNTIDLTVANVHYNTILRTPRKGLCTSYLAGLKLGDVVPARIINKNVRFPETDYLIVSTGAGIAGAKPIIEVNSHHTNRNMILFTGHRFSNKDFLYGSQWPNVTNLNVIGCFSKSCGDAQGKKIKNIYYEKGYVQTNLWKLKDEVKNVLNTGASVYVCGSSGKMPTEVRITINEIMEDEKFVSCLENAGKYIEDVW